jgi:hypothetical protein
MLTIFASVVLGTYDEVADDDYLNRSEDPMDYFNTVHRKITNEPGKKSCILL